MERRVAVLGLDAMSFDYLRKLVDRGATPYIKELLNSRGKTSVLEALPPVTTPSWSSIMTGVNPGKHGVFSFFSYERVGDGWRQRIVSSLDLMHPRVHEMLSMIGKSSVVLNPIPDQPIIPVPRAKIVSNMFFVSRQLCYPRKACDFFSDPERIIRASVIKTCKIIDEYEWVVEEYVGAVERIIKEGPDLLWVNLNIPDAILHKCTELVEGKALASELRLYGVVDKLARLMGNNHDTLIIVSDHGFTKYEGLVSVNDILAREGFAKLVNRPPELSAVFRSPEKAADVKEARVPPALITAIKRTRLKGVAKKALGVVERLTGKRISVYSNLWPDTRSSVAFLPYHLFFGVLLNDPGKREEVMAALRKYSDLITVKPPEEAYPGRYWRRGPDIVVMPRTDRGVWINPPYAIGTAYLRDTVYHHHPDGILIVGGDTNIKELLPNRIPNYSVAQIVMHEVGAPLPKSRDGVRALEQLFSKKDEMDYLSRWRIVLAVQRKAGGRK